MKHLNDKPIKEWSELLLWSVNYWNGHPFPLKHKSAFLQSHLVWAKHDKWKGNKKIQCLSQHKWSSVPRFKAIKKGYSLYRSLFRDLLKIKNVQRLPKTTISSEHERLLPAYHSNVGGQRFQWDQYKIDSQIVLGIQAMKCKSFPLCENVLGLMIMWVSSSAEVTFQTKLSVSSFVVLCSHISCWNKPPHAALPWHS